MFSMLFKNIRKGRTGLKKRRVCLPAANFCAMYNRNPRFGAICLKSKPQRSSGAAASYRTGAHIINLVFGNAALFRFGNANGV